MRRRGVLSVVVGYAVATNAIVVAQWWRETLHDDDLEHDTYYATLIVLGALAGIVAGALLADPRALGLVAAWLPLELVLAANAGVTFWLPFALLSIGIGIALRHRPPPWPSPLGLPVVIAFVAAGAIAAYGPETALFAMFLLAIAVGAVLDTWWALLLPLVPLALSVPAGYGSSDGDLPIWFGFLFFTIGEWLLIAVGIGGRRVVRRLARSSRAEVQH